MIYGKNVFGPYLGTKPKFSIKKINYTSCQFILVMANIN